MICFHCKKEIEQERMMIALDRPYLNLFFHRECYNLYVEADVFAYLGKYEQSVVELSRNDNKKGKNG